SLRKVGFQQLGAGEHAVKRLPYSILELVRQDAGEHRVELQDGAERLVVRVAPHAIGADSHECAKRSAALLLPALDRVTATGDMELGVIVEHATDDSADA